MIESLNNNVKTNGNVVKEWKCKGKFQYFSLGDGERSVWITLGMSGKFEFAEPSSSGDYSTVGRHGRVRFDFVEEGGAEGGDIKALIFDDARNFGTVKCVFDGDELEGKLKRIGPDILADGSEELTSDKFISVVSKLRTNPNVCKFLMNQSRISGVGNYILAEGLYKAKVDPWCNVKDLPEDTLRVLISGIKETARESLKAQGMTREKGGSFRSIDGKRGKFEFELMVYGKEVCPRGERVERIVEGPHGRAIWFVMSQVEEGRREEIQSLLDG